MELNFRKGTMADTENFIQFLEEVKAAMPQQDWFYLDPPETVRELMADGTMELWAETESRLLLILSIPGWLPLTMAMIFS